MTKRSCESNGQTDACLGLFKGNSRSMYVREERKEQGRAALNFPQEGASEKVGKTPRKDGTSK